MDKRKLSAIPRDEATEDMLEISERLGNIRHIVTARLVEEDKILLLNFYETAKLKKGKKEAAFRTFLSNDDYITQDLSTSKVKWKIASFYGMYDFSLWDSEWNSKKNEFDHISRVFIRSSEEQNLIEDFFSDYATNSGKLEPWDRVYCFQEHVLAKRLEEKHNKELKAVDEAMEPIKDAPQEFYDWVWDRGMSFSRYLIYKDIGKGQAECECTHCKTIKSVNRSEIRLRNNEKGICPFCGSPVTIKAKGKMPFKIHDERWFVYVDPTEEGFIFRYFHAYRNVRKDSYIEDYCFNKGRLEESIFEYSRAIYTFPNGKPHSESYEWAIYKQRGGSRWCPDTGKIACMECVMYPGNLPGAWEHTPMKYSALELLSENCPTISFRYEDGIETYLKFPKLEWVCKMGLNKLARHIIYCKAGRYAHGVSKIHYNKDTIYEILGLTKENVRVLQAADGGDYELRLLQVAQQVGIRFTPQQLKEYYETFECNTDLLRATKRKVSLHKLVKYITKESENYPIGERGGCWQYSYMRHTEREDPRIERKRNCAHDWLEYLKWCEELKYDLGNKFIYMTTNFKKVHDRTAKEYQELQDKKAAEEKRRREAAAKKAMEQTRKAMEEIFEKNNGVDAFSINGKGLILVVPHSAAEIKAEGEALHHCVGGYVDRVARGETNIFFVRKENEPDKSYFTMEWKDNKIVQCRGFQNCGMPPEVKAFVTVFEKKMQESIRKGEENGKRKKKNLQPA